MSNIPIGIAAEIRSELGRQRMTMRDLADKSGLSYDSIRRKVKEETREITVGELSLIAQAVNVRVSALVLRAEEAPDALADKVEGMRAEIADLSAKAKDMA